MRHPTCGRRGAGFCSHASSRPCARSCVFGRGTPFEPCAQLAWTIPYVDSNGERHTDVGDFSVTTRFLLSETRDVSQCSTSRSARRRAISTKATASRRSSPTTSSGLTGGADSSSAADSASRRRRTTTACGKRRPTFLGNLSAGYYFTPHDLAPAGDLVWCVSTNLTRLTDKRAPNTTTLTFTPGYRTYLGWNLYWFGGVELPATQPMPFDYQVLAELLMPF